MPVPFALLADITLIIHTLFIAFVILGAIVVILGGFKKWMWVRNPFFRWAHLVGILFITTQSWLCKNLSTSLRQLGFLLLHTVFLVFWSW